MVNFNITIEKKHVWVLALLIVAVSFVVAFGTSDPATMGHSLGELEGLDAHIDGRISQAATTAPPLTVSECEIATSSGGTQVNGPSWEIYAQCPSDKFLMGGGCTPYGWSGIRVNRPEIDANGIPRWFCLMTQDRSSAHALCCKVG